MQKGQHFFPSSSFYFPLIFGTNSGKKRAKIYVVTWFYVGKLQLLGKLKIKVLNIKEKSKKEFFVSRYWDSVS